VMIYAWPRLGLGKDEVETLADELRS
jgi:hypothetical protein